MTGAPSDKPFKVAEHRWERRAVRVAVKNDQSVPPSEFFGDPWHLDKDGKGYFADHDPSLMRK